MYLLFLHHKEIVVEVVEMLVVEEGQVQLEVQQLLEMVVTEVLQQFLVLRLHVLVEVAEVVVVLQALVVLAAVVLQDLHQESLLLGQQILVVEEVVAQMVLQD
jgi:hypothetical protein